MASLFNRLFRKKTPPASTPSVPEINPPLDIGTGLSSEQLTISTQAEVILEVPQLIVGVSQSVGMQRDHNEDSLFTLTTNLLVDEKKINLGLYIVADGMGGHENGELASRLAVDKLASHVINALCIPLISSADNKRDFSQQEIMLTGVLEGHQAIKRATEGGGTTLTGALILGDLVTLVHVGDSRAYYIDPYGNMKLITRDHSLVKRLEEIGQISPDQALSHPQRNVLYRALGQGEPFEPDITSFHMCQGCKLLLCSDGLWGVMPDDALATLASSSIEPQIACQALIQAANEAGGPDNISVIIVRLPE